MSGTAASAQGTFLLVLHSHLPYVRGAGRWPHGEEWVHEAILGTYIPLLVALSDLEGDGVPYRLTLGLTPSLLEQLAHPDIDRRFLEYADDQVARAERDARTGETPGRRALAEFYARSYTALRVAYVERFRRDLVGAFAALARSGHVEVLTSAATHGYLPLLDEPSVHAQLALGLAATRRRLCVEPRGIWLPECAYRPGLEILLERHGLTHFFTDPSLQQGAPARDRAGGGSPPAWSVTPGGRQRPAHAAGEGPMRAHRVAGSLVRAIPRHAEVSGQVWSGAIGYPGDPAYREFHRKDDRSGLRYWRVTDTALDIGAKEEYAVAEAADRVRTHAAHFASLVRRELEAARARTGQAGLVTATFDSELFGHWWFEGVDWLSLVLRDLAPLTATAQEYLAAEPAGGPITLREGSWGRNGDHSNWANPATEWMWERLRRMSADAVALRARPPAEPLRARAAAQAVRELLLAQSSDWPFLLTTGQAADYAAERFRSHADRFDRMLDLVRAASAADANELAEVERADDLFPEASVDAFADPAAVAA